MTGARRVRGVTEAQLREMVAVSGTATVRSIPDTAVRDSRSRILDAAETLFADHGYDGVSIRDITRHAGIELGLVHYYFGRKDDLFGAVVTRRAGEHCNDMLCYLDAAQAAAAPLPASVEAVLGAFLRGVLEKRLLRGEGWRSYIRLIAIASDLYATKSSLVPFMRPYGRVINRYLDALSAALPACPRERIDWAFWFCHSTIANAIRQSGELGPRAIISGSSADPADLERLLIPFYAAGFYRLAGE